MKRIENLILIDDDVVTNHLHVLLLNCWDISENIDIALNGLEALDILSNKYTEQKKHQEILILLDINMPYMNGFEFLKKFEEDYINVFPNIHIAILSSSVSSGDRYEAFRFQIAGYFEKPLTTEKIKRLIKSMRGETSLLANRIKDL